VAARFSNRIDLLAWPVEKQIHKNEAAEGSKSSAASFFYM
jgi:hypothetical protein